MREREARLAFEVDDVTKADCDFQSLVRAHHGDVEQDEASLGGGRASEATVVARVPDGELDALLEEASGVGTLVARDVKMRDVGMQYFDAQILERNLVEEIRRAEELLARAATIADVLTIDQRLADLRLRLDQVRGQLVFMKDHVERAVVSVHFATPRGAADEDVVTTRPDVHVFPNVRGAMGFDWRGQGGATSYAGGGVSLTFPSLFGEPISRGFSIDVDALTYAGGPRPTGNGAVFALALGTDSYSDFLGGGRRRWLNPFVEMATRLRADGVDRRRRRRPRRRRRSPQDARRARSAARRGARHGRQSERAARGRLSFARRERRVLKGDSRVRTFARRARYRSRASARTMRGMEVTARLVRDCLRAATALGLSRDELLAGLSITPADLESTRARIPWNDCATMFERARAMLGSDERVEEIGRLILELSSSWALLRLVPHVVSPRRVLHVAFGFAGPSIFPHMYHRVEERPGGVTRLTLALPPPYKPSEAFFRGCVGGIRALPTLLGYAPAVVAVQAIRTVGPHDRRHAASEPDDRGAHVARRRRAARRGRPLR